MREIANNTFNDGLLMDMQPLTTPNTVLTDCLNGTLITYDGNEFVLQSDDGNARVGKCRLTKDFIPLGVKEYGGIIYIVSQNPFTGECEIGSFPSPESTIFTQPDVNPETILSFKDITNSEDEGYITTHGIQKQNIKLDFPDLNNQKKLLKPGDKFAIYLTDTEGGNESFLNESTFKKFEGLLEKYNNLEVSTRNLFKLKLVRISDDGVSESIKDIVPAFSNSDKGRFYYNKSEILNSPYAEGYFAVYNNKINGYLAVILEVEQIDEFNLSIGNDITTKVDPGNGEVISFGFDINMSSRVTKECKNNVSGLEITTTEIDSSGILGEPKTVYANIDDSELQTWNVDPTLNPPLLYKYPKGPEVSIKENLEDFDASSNVKIEITPYSKFNKFENLKYENVLNYNRLTYTQESSIWKYYLDRSNNTNIQPDKVLINFDFFVRNTVNKRNKLDAMYIEFYDVISNTSLFYPITSISDSKSISIDCFTDMPVAYESSGGVPADKLTTEKYYLLINKNKVNVYNQALRDIDTGNDYSLMKQLAANDTYDATKHIPDVCVLKSVFQNSTRFDNLGIQKKEYNNKLRSDNFYIAAICGLDYYPNKKEYKTYVSYNFLWTTGVFNKYWALSGSEDLNFNSKKYPDFLDIKFNKTRNSWEDYTEVGELSENTNTDNVNNPNSFQSYTDPVFDISSTKEDFNTRININGDIENNYKMNIDVNRSVLNYGKILHLDQENINYSDAVTSKTLSQDEYNIQEDNNESSLTTDTKAKTISITTLSGDSNWDPLEGIKVKFNIFSNRKIQTKAKEDTLKYPQYKYVSFRELYGNVNIFPSTLVVVGAQGRSKRKYFWLNQSDTFLTTPLWDTIGFKEGDVWKAHRGATREEFLERLNQIAPAKSFLLQMRKDVSKGPAGYGIGTMLDSKNVYDFNERLFMITQGRCVPIYYNCSTQSTYQEIQSSLNTSIQNNWYFRSIDSNGEALFKIPNTGLLYHHDNFNSVFNFKLPIVKATSTDDLSIYTFYKGVEKKLNTLYSSFKSQVITSVEDPNYKVIGNLFNTKSEINPNIYIENLPSQKLNTEIIFEDKYTLNGENFILTTKNSRYSINNIIEILKHPQDAVDGSTLDNTWEGTTVFPSSIFVKDPDHSTGYYLIDFSYDPSEGLRYNRYGYSISGPKIYAYAQGKEDDNASFVDMFSKEYELSDKTMRTLLSDKVHKLDYDNPLN